MLHDDFILPEGTRNVAACDVLYVVLSSLCKLVKGLFKQLYFLERVTLWQIQVLVKCAADLSSNVVVKAGGEVLATWFMPLGGEIQFAVSLHVQVPDMS